MARPCDGRDARDCGENRMRRQSPTSCTNRVPRPHDNLQEEALIKVSVMYFNKPGVRFDHDYYRTKHLPLIKSRMGAALKYYTIDKGLADGKGSSPCSGSCSSRSLNADVSGLQDLACWRGDRPSLRWRCRLRKLRTGTDLLGEARPTYRLGRGRRTVTCMSLVSSIGERAEGILSTDSLMGAMTASFQGLWVRSGPDPERTMSRIGYPILSRNSSAALPTRFTRVMSRTVRSGCATYQPSAVT